ncbi:cyclic pyranopterin phosphate synthase [Aquimarina sp. EL_43]|uniref:GTP 3',8-cyclase MoaA n=1 Tax=Aquimarina TaxID=290174 RepID=UPI0004718322|nr:MULTISPECIES: GTP 3',8-cyclase MoaA [Aquimarina]MBG6131820.1 cyclic pyranopterin phosphate synthase [Aquimarina sp. EL_35]MBG6149384.1 cyclic pyranopterin phosphate synthase [Aquimarina sp. EL_32]MBG6170353.1 cyclic pyranopterin phosphate synthase [Aquimarina sp. EL_43]
MTKSNILTDTFGRKHNYLRISLTERCNLRCTYCMPADGIQLSPKDHLMTYEEIYTIAKEFVSMGVTKIRLTGGEPLIRKDAALIMEKLSSLPVQLTLTTNGVIVDKFIDHFKKCGIKTLNVSLDSLDTQKNKEITRRSYFEKVYQNIILLVKEGFLVKVNCVLMKGFNDDEVIDFINLSKNLPVHVRFIEFMPFDGNQWNMERLVSLQEILSKVHSNFEKNDIVKLQDAPNDTTKSYQIKGYQGTFAIISSVTNPFCDGCNRIRLTANGQIKNCLFSSKESDLLTKLRAGESIIPIIQNAVQTKFKVRNGMDTLEKFNQSDMHSNNRSMIAIGG